MRNNAFGHSTSEETKWKISASNIKRLGGDPEVVWEQQRLIRERREQRKRLLKEGNANHRVLIRRMEGFQKERDAGRH